MGPKASQFITTLVKLFVLHQYISITADDWMVDWKRISSKGGVVPAAQQMIKDILGYRRRFAGLAKQVDDTSFIVVKIGEDFRR